MGSCLSSQTVSNSSIPTSVLHPTQWSQEEIIIWLQQTSNLSELIKIFKKHKISGLTFANLSQEELQSELHITQFGVVKEFIILRDKLLSDYNKDTSHDHTHTQTHSNNKIPNTPSSTGHKMPTLLLSQIQNSHNETDLKLINDERETSPLLSDHDHEDMNIIQLNTETNTATTNTTCIQQDDNDMINAEYEDEYYDNINMTAENENDNEDDDCFLENLMPPAILDSVRTNKTDSNHRNRMLHAYNHGWKVELMQQTNAHQIHNKDKRMSVDMITVNDLKWKRIRNENSNDVLGIMDNEYNIYDYTFMEQYADISYIGGSKLVIEGVIHALSLLCRNRDNRMLFIVSELTYKYYFEPEKHVFQFGYDIWKILYKINRIEIIDDMQYKSFIGNDLVIETRRTYWNKYRFGNTIGYCNDLLKCKYIELIGKKEGAKKPNNPMGEYLNDAHYLYQFAKVKKRQYKKYHYFVANVLDRNSWNIGTQVEVFSSTLNGWVFGEIIKITGNNDIVVSYDGGYDSKYLFKTVNRNDNKLIRSTRDYVVSRNKWNIGKSIEIFSHSDMKWCIGIIEAIIPKDTNNNVSDTLRIKYKKSSDRLYYTKRIDHWSCDLRNIQIINDKKLLKYKYNKQCEIYLHDEQIWIINKIKDVIPMHKYVIVENTKTKMERIIDVNSKFIRIVNE